MLLFGLVARACKGQCRIRSSAERNSWGREKERKNARGTNEELSFELPETELDPGSGSCLSLILVERKGGTGNRRERERTKTSKRKQDESWSASLSRPSKPENDERTFSFLSSERAVSKEKSRVGDGDGWR